MNVVIIVIIIMCRMLGLLSIQHIEGAEIARHDRCHASGGCTCLVELGGSLPMRLRLFLYSTRKVMVNSIQTT